MKHLLTLLLQLIFTYSLTAQFEIIENINPSFERLWEIEVIDLNGDGHLDILSHSNLYDKLAWYPNFGNGQFGRQQVLGNDSTYLSELAVGDINGDGLTDILIERYNLDDTTYIIDWFENIGGGSFNPSQVLWMPEESVSDIILYDFDGDGDLDIIYSLYNQFSSREIGWLENAGQGSFDTSHTIVSAAWYVTNIYPVDFNGDGILDIVYRSDLHGLLWVAGEGDGSYSDPMTLSSATTFDNLKLVDLDGDGYKDIIYSRPNYTFFWNRNQGDGTLSSQMVVTSGGQPASLGLMDVNLDGKMDIIVGYSNAQLLAWVPNLGGGEFGAEETINNSILWPEDLEIADINGDNLPDIIACAYDASEESDYLGVYYYEDEYGGDFSNVNIVAPQSYEAIHAIPVNINNDSLPDLLVPSYGDGEISWYRNICNGAYSHQNVVTTGSGRMVVAKGGDLNNDGLEDIVFFHNKSLGYRSIEWTPNLGDGTFGDPLILNNSIEVDDLYLHDLDQDGDLDIIIDPDYTWKIVWLENLGNGIFADALHEVEDIGSVHDIWLGDLNGDELSDLIVYKANDKDLIWYPSLGGGDFGDAELLSENDFSYRELLFFDADSDSDKDIIFFTSKNIGWYENEGGSISSLEILSEEDKLAYILAVDIDDDGDQDILAAYSGFYISGTYYEKSRLVWFENLSDTGFASEQELYVGEFLPKSLSSLDVDLDGDLDFVINSKDDNVIEILRNPLYETPLKPVTAAVTVLNPTLCGDQADGVIIIEPACGNPPYTIDWMAEEVEGFWLSGLSSGIYPFIISDANGNIFEDTVKLLAPPPLQLSITAEPTVNNHNLGFIISQVEGGVPPYEYHWSTPTSSWEGTNELTSLDSGVYTLSIIDQNACEISQSIEVGQLDFEVFALASNNSPLNCYSDTEGQIAVQIYDGVAPFNINWSEPELDGYTLDGLLAGDYSYTITDANGDFYTETISITAPPPLNLEVSTMPELDLEEDGMISVGASGGVPPYTYLWSNGETEATITNLSSGFYTLTLTDANGCILSETVEVERNVEGLLVNTLYDPILCAENPTGGLIAIDVLLGLPPYDVEWSILGQDGLVAFNLEAGTYSYQLTDANGNMFADTVTIVQTDSIEVEVITTPDLDGEGSGSAQVVSTSGGTPSYTYLWLTFPVQYGPVANNMQVGTYDLIVQDFIGCTLIEQVEITMDYEAIQLEVISNPLSCYGDTNGMIQVNVSQGVPPYEIIWDAPELEGFVVSGLGSGVYTFTIVDSVNHMLTDTVVITEPAPIEAEIATSPDLNNTHNGSAEIISINGGTEPYTYTWLTTPVQTGLIASDLAAGIYELIIEDTNGCSQSLLVEIPLEEVALQVEVSNSDLLCFGDMDATIQVEVLQGVPPYEIVWDNPEFEGFVLTGLESGIYPFTVLDISGNAVEDTVIITEPALIEVDITSFPEINGMGNGSAEVNNIEGGTSPYMYLWNTQPPQEGTMAVNLSSGIYELIITDANGCEEVVEVEIGILNDVHKLNKDFQMDVFPTVSSNGRFSIRTQNEPAGPYLLKIRTTDGRLLKELSLNSLDGSGFSLNQFPAGYYYMETYAKEKLIARLLLGSVH